MLSPTGHRSPTAAQTSPVSTGNVSQSPAELPAGSLVTGTVAGRSAEGYLLLRTDAGTLPFETRLDLERGAVVTLRIGEGPRLAAAIELVDGQPARATAPALLSDGARLEKPLPAATSLTVNNLLTAVVIASYPEPAATALPNLNPVEALGLPSVTAGSRITLQIVSIGAPLAETGTPSVSSPAGASGLPSNTAGSAPLGTPAGPQSNTGFPSSPFAAPQSNAAPVPVGSASAPAPTGPASVPALATTVGPVPPGSTASPEAVHGAVATSRPNPFASAPAPSTAGLTGAQSGLPSTAAQPASPTPAGVVAAEIRSHAPPRAQQAPQVQTAAPAAAESAAKPTFLATVTGVDSAGRPVLSTPFGTLQVEARAPLPIGTTLTLALTEAGPRALAAPLAARSVAGVNSPLGLAHDWPALREVVDALRHIDPKLADHIVQRVIAAPGTNLAQGALFFLSALRGGDIAGWLGRGVVRTLEDGGRGDLVRRLAGDFGQIARFADQPAAGEWQPILVPLHDGEQLKQLRLFVRRNRGDGDDEDGGTRFVVDVELSRLGELQLDGLLYEKRFDLILRSHEPMANVARSDIGAIFSDGLTAAGLVGTLRFQVAKPFPVAPLDEIFSGDHDGVLV